MFAVVETTTTDGSKEVTAVPMLWVTNDILSWPKHLKERKKAIVKQAAPNETWQKYPCVVLCSNIGIKNVIYICA